MTMLKLGLTVLLIQFAVPKAFATSDFPEIMDHQSLMRLAPNKRAAYLRQIEKAVVQFERSTRLPLKRLCS